MTDMTNDSEFLRTLVAKNTKLEVTNRDLLRALATDAEKIRELTAERNEKINRIAFKDNLLLEWVQEEKDWKEERDKLMEDVAAIERLESPEVTDMTAERERLLQWNSNQCDTILEKNAEIKKLTAQLVHRDQRIEKLTAERDALLREGFGDQKEELSRLNDEADRLSGLFATERREADGLRIQRDELREGMKAVRILIAPVLKMVASDEEGS